MSDIDVFLFCLAISALLFFPILGVLNRRKRVLEIEIDGYAPFSIKGLTPLQISEFLRLMHAYGEVVKKTISAYDVEVKRLEKALAEANDEPSEEQLKYLKTLGHYAAILAEYQEVRDEEIKSGCSD
jgi:hypothetical protein